MTPKHITEAHKPEFYYANDQAQAIARKHFGTTLFDPYKWAEVWQSRNGCTYHEFYFSLLGEKRDQKLNITITQY